MQAGEQGVRWRQLSPAVTPCAHSCSSQLRVQSRIKELEIALEGLRQQQREAKRKGEAAAKEVATHKAELDSARAKLQQLQQVLGRHSWTLCSCLHLGKAAACNPSARCYILPQQSGCLPRRLADCPWMQEGGPVDRHTRWHPTPERDAKDPELAAILRKVKHTPAAAAARTARAEQTGTLLEL